MDNIDPQIVEDIKRQERARIAKRIREQGTEYTCPKCFHTTYIIILDLDEKL